MVHIASSFYSWFPLVIRIGVFYDIPTSGIHTTSVNTASKTSQKVGDFYDECEHEIYLSRTSGIIDFIFLAAKS